MEKRYQVFISSTYRDLQEERSQVIQALLELDCIPAGMEMFPASNEDQWTLIKKVIDDCDYYLLIVGNRYGSLDVTGISYTEKEYDYAIEQGKPVMAFLHEDAESRPARDSEPTEEGKKKLAAFREKIQRRMCQFWRNPEDLGGKVSRSYVKLIKNDPAEGWVRGRFAADTKTLEQLNALRNRISELENELTNARTSAPTGSKGLAQGDDEFEVEFTYRPQDEYGDKRASTHIPWDAIFSTIAPAMFNEAVEHTLRNLLNNTIDTFWSHSDESSWNNSRDNSIAISSDSFHTIMTQLKALGLTTLSQRKRTASATGTYWTLTPYGDTVATQLIAIRRPKKTNSKAT
ncbi:DUF4062 domain-containing protein [Myxococcus xanthus]|uniref:DUF4062 domain-containing protein n=1 Tax=Myxococcus xanthus TaxID=34 RepID=UPI0011260BAA|nr:DUF4062 domain-containing protein [Myxococcus xanthus]QDF03343.1 hypothetical protein BHS04_08985 [Myxococcus xanthus]